MGYIGSSRTLASETQLHDQIALTVWKLTCPMSDTDDSAKPLKDNLENWSKRYVEIQAIPNASAPGGNQNGASPGGGNEGMCGGRGLSWPRPKAAARRR